MAQAFWDLEREDADGDSSTVELFINYTVHHDGYIEINSVSTEDGDEPTLTPLEESKLMDYLKDTQAPFAD
jgi:hypothetical protein